ncbi:MAG: transposase [Gammaproteobacteria bacterium]
MVEYFVDNNRIFDAGNDFHGAAAGTAGLDGDVKHSLETLPPRTLLQKTSHEVSRSTDKCLSEKRVANVQKRYRCILTQGEAELPPIPDKPSGKRGRIAKSDAHNLLERLRKYETAVLLFAQDSNVPFTNNRAERDLRMAKVKQKVSGCFRSELYAQAYCRISSYVQTMQNKGYNPLLAIQLAFAGQASALGGE